ncbi:hypothetical protein [Sinomonas atrocyanea]
MTLLYPNVRGVSELKVYDPAAVREQYGIEPHQHPGDRARSSARPATT